MSLPQGPFPVLPLRNMVLFPGLTQAIRVGRPRSVQALLSAEKQGFWIVAVQQKQIPKGSDPSDPEPESLYTVGTLCRIDSMKGSPDGGYQVVARGFHRVRLEQIRLNEHFLETDTSMLADVADLNEATTKSVLESLKQMASEVLKLIPANTEQLIELVRGVEDLSFLTSLCAGNIELEAKEKQKILEMVSLKERSLHILNILKDFKEGLEVQSEIRAKLNQKMGQQQRQNILREHLKAIRDELGDDSGGGDATFERKIETRLEAGNFPEDVRKLIEQEMRRLNEIGNQSPEANVIRNYVDLLSTLPWNKTGAGQEIDLEEARRILDRDHSGLDKVKKRIIQQLAVMKLKKEAKGSILLFVGPPGVGKTSLGQSIAKALGRKFTRVSVGGIRDDAEIRGHRRTYVGAMPGRIIQGIKRAEENNPVFLLDEIDKISRGFHGDPAAALLEVLDPEQNASFLDHYLDVGFDLSKIFFIATANQLDTIPPALLDRMEVIEISGYTLAEKLHIARHHLLPKQLRELGMSDDDVRVSDDALIRIMSSYTREAGVRELERKIASLLRGVSERVVAAKLQTETPPACVQIEAADVIGILGRERFFQEVTETINPPGVVTGLAWTPVGGDILFIESTAMPGKGELVLTGQLGEVMKESAKIGLSLIRTHLSKFGLTGDLSRHDIHIHVPAGAIPKDGPSAGVALFVSLVSLLTRRSVASTLAMTGEITLRGSITQVGGIKEKVIAAHRAGVTDVILPEKNRRDLEDIPKEIQDQLRIHFVSRVEELLKIVFGLQVENMAPQFLLETIKPQTKSGQSEN